MNPEISQTTDNKSRHSWRFFRAGGVYCDCVRRGGTEKMSIAAAFTAGDSDQLMAGRNGVFYDRSGLDWDATVVRIIEHPISVRQAFWAPYKRVGRMVGEQFSKIAANRAKEAEEKTAAAVVDSGQKAAEGKQPAAQAFDVGKYAGIFAAIGLAIGALGTAAASLMTGLMRLQWWQAPFAIAGMILLISGPSVIIAWFKLRQRNLGPLLDANSWAVNARARINIPFGASLTAEAGLPAGVQMPFIDPFAEKERPWRLYIFILFLLAVLIALWDLGILNRWIR